MGKKETSDSEPVMNSSLNQEKRDDSEKAQTESESESDSDSEVIVNLKGKGVGEDLKKGKTEMERKAGNMENRFLSDVLPRLPKTRNGMRIMGVNEQSPLIDCGELYKLRIFRPDKPLATSEIFEDGTRVRFTNLSKIGSDDFTISKFKIEAVTFQAGLADEDMIGTEATKGVFEAEDACNLTMKPFIEKKVKGKTSRVDNKSMIGKFGFRPDVCGVGNRRTQKAERK